MIIVHSSLHATSSVASWSGQSAQQRQHPVMASSVETNVTDLIERLASRSEIKHGYGSHRQQPQNHGQNDELDPFLVVREPSMMHAVHGEPPYGPIQPNTLSHLRADVPGLHLIAVLGHDPGSHQMKMAGAVLP